MTSFVQAAKDLKLKTRLHIQLPSYILLALRDEAAYQQRSVTNLIAHVVTEYMRARPKERWTETERQAFERT